MSLHPEEWKATPAQVAAFTNQTALMPVMALDAINDELTAFLAEDPQAAELYETLRSPATCDYIEGRSALVFENNPEFRKKLLTADPRPFYFGFVRLWVAGVVKAQFPLLYRKIPSHFATGLPV